MLSLRLPFIPSFFFFNDTATTEIYTLSLHDALPIWQRRERIQQAEYADRLRHPLEPPFAGIFGPDLRPIHRQPDGLAEQDLAGTSHRLDAGGDVHWLTEHVARGDTHFAEVDFHARPQPLLRRGP